MGQNTDPDASGNAPRLYNLDQEIGEQTNLAAKHPEVVAKLQSLAAKMTAEIGFIPIISPIWNATWRI